MRRLQMSSTGGSMGQGLVGARPPGISMQGQHSLPSGPPLTMNLMNSGSSGALSNDYSHQLVNELGIDPANITNQVFVANVSTNILGLIYAIVNIDL